MKKYVFFILCLVLCLTIFLSGCDCDKIAAEMEKSRKLSSEYEYGSKGEKIISWKNQERTGLVYNWKEYQ